MIEIIKDILTFGLRALVRALKNSIKKEIENDISDQQERLFYLKFEIRMKEKLIDKYVLAEYPFICLMAENAKKYVQKNMPEVAEQKIREFDDFISNVGRYKDLMLEKLIESNKKQYYGHKIPPENKMH
ncbi:MAG: hypothetical protein E7Y34_02685 [Mycoplasma sp.]|nr:hypothetical protein [Mycoplasma sp.]